MPSMGITILYRFYVRPGAEAEFVRHWRTVTRWLRDHCGGLGSRLHRAADGTLIAYAQWPDAAARERAFAMVAPPGIEAARTAMRAMLVQPTTEETLIPIADELTRVAFAELESPS